MVVESAFLLLKINTMSDKGLREDIHKLYRDFIKYSELRWEYFKLEFVESLVLLYTKIFSFFLMWIIVPVFLFFILVGLAIYLGDILGKMYYGFFIVGGVILLLGLLVILLRRPLITNPLINALIKSMFEEQKPLKNAPKKTKSAQDK